MNTFKECLAEDYSDAIKKSFDILLGKINNQKVLPAKGKLEGLPKIVETPDSRSIMDTFRPA